MKKALAAARITLSEQVLPPVQQPYQTSISNYLGRMKGEGKALYEATIAEVDKQLKVPAVT